jgi:hypothetical protein
VHVDTSSAAFLDGVRYFISKWVLNANHGNRTPVLASLVCYDAARRARSDIHSRYAMRWRAALFAFADMMLNPTSDLFCWRQLNNMAVQDQHLVSKSNIKKTPVLWRQPCAMPTTDGNSWHTLAS